MMKCIETGLMADVAEHNGSIVHEAARGDRSRLGIFNCRACNAGRDSHARGGGFFFMARLLSLVARGHEENRK